MTQLLTLMQLRKQVKTTLGRGQVYLTGLPASVSFGEVAKTYRYQVINPMKAKPNKHDHFKDEVFTQGSFREDMEILIDSPRGSLSVTQSRTKFVNSHPLVFYCVPC